MKDTQRRVDRKVLFLVLTSSLTIVDDPSFLTPMREMNSDMVPHSLLFFATIRTTYLYMDVRRELDI